MNKRDILLDEVEIAEVKDKVRRENACSFRLLAGKLDEAICLRQLGKVDEVLFAPWEEKLQARIATEDYVENRVRLDVALRAVQAARQALSGALL